MVFDAVIAYDCVRAAQTPQNKTKSVNVIQQKSLKSIEDNIVRLQATSIIVFVY